MFEIDVLHCSVCMIYDLEYYNIYRNRILRFCTAPVITVYYCCHNPKFQIFYVTSFDCIIILNNNMFNVHNNILCLHRWLRFESPRTQALIDDNAY